MKSKVVYSDNTEEILEHYGCFVHSSGGFGFYQDAEQNEYVFVGANNVKKIIKNYKES